MIVFLTLIYCAALFVLIRMKVLPDSKVTWASTGVWVVLLLIFLFIPMQWGAPSGPVRVMTRVVQIVPNVSGQVVAVEAKPNQPMAAGQVLFRIDPEPFEIATKLAEATLVRVQTQSQQDIEALADAEANLRRMTAAAEYAQARYDDDKRLVESEVYSENRLETRQSNLDQALAAADSARTAVSRAQAEVGAVMENGEPAKVAEAKAKLDQARWNLDKTVVRAPVDGYVTNLALAAGQRSVNLPFAPSMAFVDTSEKTLVLQVNQNFLRHIKTSQLVEVALKPLPGHVFFGTVDAIVPANSGGQAQVGGSVAAATQITAEPFLVRIALDDAQILKDLPAGAVGTAAVYTESSGATHVIRKVTMRMTAILNYINPAL